MTKIDAVFWLGVLNLIVSGCLCLLLFLILRTVAN